MAAYRAAPVERAEFISRASTASAGGFEVRAVVPGAAEAEPVLGVDVYERDIQPVWIEVRNTTDTRARIVLSSIDPKYFPPAEVAWFFKSSFSKEGWQDMERQLIERSLPRRVEPGETVSGFVFTNVSPGTKAFNLDIFHGTVPPSFEQFTFFLRVPGFVPDYTEVRFSELYPEQEQVHVSAEALPAALSEFACCTTDASGEAPGRPVNVFIVAEPLTLLRSLLRAGWVETPSGEAFAATRLHHFFGRPADGTFRKPRDGATDRSELSIWKTPVLVDGKVLWAAQSRHAIGRRFPLGERLFGVRLDPDVSEGRNYVLQTFWYAQTLDAWGFSPTGSAVAEDQPALDFQDNPWFSLDEADVVLWLSGEPVPMNDAALREWPAAEPATRALP